MINVNCLDFEPWPASYAHKIMMCILLVFVSQLQSVSWFSDCNNQTRKMYFISALFCTYHVSCYILLYGHAVIDFSDSQEYFS